MYSISLMINLYNSYWKYHKFNHLPDFKYKWPVISKYLPKNQDLSILDHGCGTGVIYKKLTEFNPKSKIYGVDVSELAIKAITKKFPKNIFKVVKDGQKLPFKTASIDFIVSLDVIEHIYNTKNILNEFYRILTPNGKLLLSTPYHGFIKNMVINIINFETVFDPYGPHIRFFTKKSLFTGLEDSGLDVIKFGYFGRFYPLSRGMFILAQKKENNFQLNQGKYI
jgi:ubiquinone/menaquinone biosynthesis C-methylase UbiE